jgi:hypothetical protein
MHVPLTFASINLLYNTVSIVIIPSNADCDQKVASKKQRNKMNFEDNYFLLNNYLDGA